MRTCVPIILFPVACVDCLPGIYPELGSCDRNLIIDWDEKNNAWAVDFELKGNKVRHYLEDADASACMFDKQCVGMSIEFGQFI